MRKLNLALFENLTKTAPQVIEAAWHEVIAHLSNVHPNTTHKNSLPLFALYKLDGTRKNESLLSFSGAVLDYDAKGEPENPDWVEDLPFAVFCYTTSSHTKSAPAYRVVIPFAEDVEPSKYLSVIEYLIAEELIPVKGLDPCVRTLSQSYFAPKMTSDFYAWPYHATNAPLLVPEYVEPLIVNRLAKAVDKKSLSSGRNDSLKRAVSAMLLDDGLSTEETIERALSLDEDMHKTHAHGCLFDDAKEFPTRSTPKARADKFVRSIAKSLKITETQIATPTIEELEEEEKEKKEIKGNYPASNIDLLPPLARSVADFLLSTVPRYSPALAVAATISFFSIIKNRNFHSPGRVFPNTYIMLAGASSVGKSQFLQPIEELLLKPLKLLPNKIGRPSSSAAIGRELMQPSHGGMGYIVWDELGGTLKGSTGRNAQSYETDLLASLNTLYDSTNVTELALRSYANSTGNQKPVKVKRPCLSILATSTEDELQRIFAGENVSSGFFPRWMIFSPSEVSTVKKRFKCATHAPHELIEQLKLVAQPYIIDDPLEATHSPHNPMIDFTDEALDLVDNMHAEITRMTEGDELAAALYGKYVVNSIKVAIALHHETIGARELANAFLLVKPTVEYAIKLARVERATLSLMPITQKRHNASVQRIYQVLDLAFSKKLWLTKREITASAKMTRVTAIQIIEDLLSTGTLVQRNVLRGDRPTEEYQLKK